MASGFGEELKGVLVVHFQFLLAVLGLGRGHADLNSLARVRTQAPCIGSIGQPLDHQEDPSCSF